MKKITTLKVQKFTDQKRNGFSHLNKNEHIEWQICKRNGEYNVLTNRSRLLIKNEINRW